eukprot:SAG31_NODE_21849_length_539_cov_1.081818_1_plen_45_part_01
MAALLALTAVAAAHAALLLAGTDAANGRAATSPETCAKQRALDAY